MMLAEALNHLPDKVATVVGVGAEKAQRFYKNAPAQQPQFSPLTDVPGGPIIPRKGTELWPGLRRIFVVQDISQAWPVA